MLAFAGVYVLLPDLVLAVYSAHGSTQNFEPIRGLVHMLLRFVALYSFFDGMAIVFGSAVRGAGDTRFSLIFIAVTSWTLMVIPTAVVFWYFGGNLVLA